jgi:hypothetical protein
MAEPPREFRYTSDREVREIFNREILPMKQAGQLTERLARPDRHPTPPLAGEPRCTRSQYISYLDDSGQEVARVHQYLRRDGTLGLSGRPDPKAVLWNGVLYYCDVNWDV